MKKKKSLIEDKRKEGHTLVETPKGTSHLLWCKFVAVYNASIDL